MVRWPRDDLLSEDSGVTMSQGVRVIVAYDGTAFAGWQEQPEQRTVQGVLADAISKMAGAKVRVRGASRTDAGVHAIGQVAAFDSPRTIDMYGWRRGLNATLPDDVAVKDAVQCAPGYDPRYDALDKLYRYLVQVGPNRDPLLRTRAWYLHPGLYTESRRGAHTADDALDVRAMRDAAARLVGTHDFKAFRGAGDERENTVRTVTEITLTTGFIGDPTLLAIAVRGAAFMKNMVRILSGTLVEVGRGRVAAEAMDALVAPGTERHAAGQTAPAHGLTLVEMKLGRSATATR